MALNDKNADRFVFAQGDTFQLGLIALDAAGQPVDCTGVTVSAEVRTPVVEWSDRARGEYALWGSGDGLTTRWPLGELRLRVTYESAEGARNFRRSSKTLYLSIVAE